MKRNELFRKTGICITAFALSAVIGTATPAVMVFASEDTVQTDASNAADTGEQVAAPAEESQSTEQTEEPADNSQQSDNSDNSGSESNQESGEEEQAVVNTDPGSNDQNVDKKAQDDSGQSDSSQTGGSDSGEVSQPAETPDDSGSSGSTEGGSTEGGSTGNTGSTETPADNSGNSDTSNTGNSQKPSSPSTDTTTTPATPTNTTEKVVPDDSAAAASTEDETATSAPSEPVAADTQTNQPLQTSQPVDATGKYKDKGTTLDPGEVPTGYDQALNYGSSNEQLIASQNIVSGLSILKNDFRFYTVDKAPAIAAKEQSVYEKMDTASRAIGLLSDKDVLYVLSEEDDGWLYIESGNVRGFIKKDDIKKGDDSGSGILSFADELVPASENKAFTYKRCTTKSTVIDKKYAVADVDASILESTGENAREIGHLAPGSLCYVIMQADEKYAYVESGNVRGFARTSNLTTGTAAKKIVQDAGEASMTLAEEYVAPADNDALYYTLNSVHDGEEFNSLRTEVVETAAQYIGNPYVWGGTSLTNGADCSGFVQTLFSMFGYNLPRVADAQSRYGTQIPISDAAPGDLIFFAANGYVYHVALYAGDGMTIEAYSENRGIIATPIGNRDAVWATRVIED